jgi:hypothetical protein
MNDESSNNIAIPSQETELAELLDSSYPLAKWFKTKCPGTFKHSQAVASMVEAVSAELGLDIQFMKVCAVYHDIGKCVNPTMFSENQLDNENPHDSLDPWISTQIITRHVADSVNILIGDPKFTRSIIEVISQHHGNDVATYFYDRAGKDADPNDFRYPCSKPKSIEAAVLLICDRVEATSRSLVQSGHFEPAVVLEQTINGLLDRSQLDNVNTKLGNLKKIREALARELEGVYQKRVDYKPPAEDIKD